MKKIALLLLFVPFAVFAQKTKVDSLKRIVRSAKTDSVKARILNEIGELTTSASPDSAMFVFNQVIFLNDNSERTRLQKAIAISNIGYVEMSIKGNATTAKIKIDSAITLFNHLILSKNLSIAKQVKKEICRSTNDLGGCMRVQGKYNEALEYYLQALEMAKTIGTNNELFEMCYLSLGNIYRYLGELDKAMEFNMAVLALYQKEGSKNKLSLVYNNIGNVYHMQGDYPKALNYYQQALLCFEESKDFLRMGSATYNIGTIHLYQKNYELAIEYYLKALSIRQNIGDKKGILNSLMALGRTYSEYNKNFDKSLDYYKKAMAIASEIDDKSGLGYANMGIANLYKHKNQPINALSYAELSLKFFLESNNASGIINITNELALIHYNLGNYSKAYELALKSYTHSKSIDMIDMQVVATSILKSAAMAQGNYKLALENANLCLKLTDSLNAINNSKAIAEMEARFQNEKKQQEIEKQNIIIEKQNVENRQKSNQRNFFIFGSILLALLVAISFRGYQQKKRSNTLLQFANSDLEQANAEILAQRDEIETQRDMVITQKERIEDINTKMTDSLRYAQSIQHAILPSEKTFATISSDYFLFMSPCELISGDFAWAMSFDNYHVFCIADCTGHGVPGAFMSVLGISAINEIVSHHRVTNAGKILDFLRENVIEALNQNEPSHLHKDGIDIGLCIYNSSSRELQFAGARIPLWLVSDNKDNIDFSNCPVKNTISLNGAILTEIKADIMPVGISPLMNSFHNVTIKLNENPISLYLATDGFADQFGGKNSEKFGKMRLKQLILDNNAMPFVEQKSIFETTFQNWMDSHSQTDDITVMGVKV